MGTKQTAILDLLCRRYPGRRPSDYLEIDDPDIAIQLDYAIAIKHELREREVDDSKLDYIGSLIKSIGQVHGVKYKDVVKTEDIGGADSKVIPQDLPVEAVLSMLGGKGTQVIKHGK